MVSGFKKSNKKKQKFQLAKDPKQAKMAAIVLIIFVINSIYTGIKIYKENNPAPVAQTTPQEQPALDLAGGAPPPSGATVDPATGLPVQQDPAAAPVVNNTAQPQADLSQDANNIYIQTIAAGNNSPSNPTAQLPDSGVEIMTKKTKLNKYGKMVTVAVDNSETANPFLPGGDAAALAPKALPYLTAPPDNVSLSSEAGKVMETTISGILYDKYSPSAIINIEGSDYLVKKGDVIKNYRVLQINKNQVVVQLGRNVYTAGVGELLSLTNVNFNTVANLNKKFGGNSVQISVKKKKGY